MSLATLAAGAALGLACAALFAAAGARTLARALRAGSAPLRAYAVFWLGAATYVGVDALWTCAALAGAGPLPLAIAVLQVKLAAACASFAGLVVYLLAIYRGRSRLNHAVDAAYLGLFLALQTYYAWRSPTGSHVGVASMGLDYARDQPGLVWHVLLVLLFAPPIVAAIAYATLWRYAADRDARRRVALTSASLLLFFAPDLAGWLVGTWPAWDLVERGLAFAAGIGIVLATAEPRPARSARGADAALQARARELI